MSSIWTKPTTLQVVARDEVEYNALVERARTLAGVAVRVRGTSGYLMAPALRNVSAVDATRVVELEFDGTVLAAIGQAVTAEAALNAVSARVQH